MQYDLVLENGRVLDPESGVDDVLAVGIADGVIKMIGKVKLSGARVIDVSGCIVAPGFIDIHAHEDFALEQADGHRVDKRLPLQAAAILLQAGVTTMVGGNCGIGVYPFDAYYQKMQSHSLPIHYLTLIGYTSLREWLGIDRYAMPSPTQINCLKKMVREGLELGWPGVSFGLQYAPGTTNRELLEAAEIIKEYDRFLAVHLRYDYPARALEAIREMLAIVKTTGVRLQLSHLAANVYGADNLKRVLRLIAELNSRGFDVKADMYPYDAWATEIKSAVFDNDPFQIYQFTYADIEILTGRYAGRRCTPELFAELRTQEEETTVACHNATPWNDIEQALVDPAVFLGSDALIARDRATGDIKGHPRSAGTTARFLRCFVKDRPLLDLKTALRKMTLDPANRLQLSAKGRLQFGKDADLTVFRLDRLREMGEYGANVCARPPEGIEYVIVGGMIAYTGKNRD